jgi:hypothetical protein
LLCFLPSCVTIYLLPAVVTCKWMPSLALAYITCQHSVSGLPVCAAISLQIFFISLSSIILSERPYVATETYNTHILYISHCDIICLVASHEHLVRTIYLQLRPVRANMQSLSLARERETGDVQWSSPAAPAPRAAPVPSGAREPPGHMPSAPWFRSFWPINK